MAVSSDPKPRPAAIVRSAAAAPAIPVMRPRLPSAEALLPYLRRIDERRVYSNFGPLAGELEERLAELIGLPPGTVALAASGAAGLAGAILAAAGPAGGARPWAVVPDYTFVATALAAEQCGYAVDLADVDEVTWALSPEAAAERLRHRPVGLVVPVAPYGRPVEQEPWLELRRRTGVAVVIDAAAGLEAVASEPGRFLGPLPVVLSLHATKSFATGEGGAVVCTDAGLLRRVVRALNYGFFDSRDCTSASFNGKMSEYHAAVGLAELDGWAAKQAGFAQVHAEYRRRLAAAGLDDRYRGTPAIASCYALLECADREEVAAVVERLDEDAIGHRLWYGQGLHAQTRFADRDHAGLTASRRLAPRLLGLPMAPDLDEPAVARVVDAVAGARAVEGVR